MQRPVTKKDYLYAISWVYQIEKELKHKEHVSKWEVDSCQYTITTYRGLLQELISKSDDAIVLANQLADKDYFKLSKDTLISNCELSCRAHNVLKWLDCKKISDLQNVTISYLKTVRNTGQKSIDEIINLCDSVGVKLKP
jgi:DNA-directed RNA polymerase alpha subunit